MILDSDNAFDFPQDDGNRAEINDTANEEKIVPEYYEPLQMFLEALREIWQPLQIIANTFSSSNLDNLEQTNDANEVKEKIDLTAEERQELKDALSDVLLFNQEQQKIISQNKFNDDEAKNLQSEWKDLKEEIKAALKDAQEKYGNLEEKELPPKDKELFEKLADGIETFEKNNKKYFSGAPQSSVIYSNGVKVIIRSEADIRKNLDTVAKSRKKIPQNHLINYLKNTLANDEYYAQLKDSSQTDKPRDVYLKNPILNNNVETAETILKFYDDLSQGKRLQLRNDLDVQLIKELPKNKKIRELMKKEKLSQSEILQMAEELKSLKKKIYKNVVGEENLDFKIKFEAPMESQSVGGAGMTKDTLMIFFEANKVTPQFVLGTLVHEMTHNEQHSMIESNNEKVGIYKDLYYLNTKKSGYLTNNADVYINQPLEKEAIMAEKMVSKTYQSMVDHLENRSAESFSDNGLTNEAVGVEKENEQVLHKKGIFSKNKNKEKLQKQSTVKFGNGDKIIIRGEKDIRNNLQKVAEVAPNIPEEHLLNYLENTLRNQNFVDTVKKIKEGNSKNNVAIKNPILNNDIQTEANINKIFQKVYANEDTSIRKEMDDKLFNRLAEDEKIVEFLNQDKLSKQDLGEMILIVAKAKKEIYKEAIGEEMDSFKVQVHKYDPQYEGGYKNGVISLYLNPDEKPLATLKTLIHEMTHAEQDSMKKSKNKQLGNLPKIYSVNSSDNGYILKSQNDYYTQPIEKEAHKAEYTIGKKLENILNTGNFSIKKSNEKAEPNKYNGLDTNNEFDSPNDNGVKTQIKDIASEEKIFNNILIKNSQSSSNGKGEETEIPLVPEKS